MTKTCPKDGVHLWWLNLAAAQSREEERELIVKIRDSVAESMTREDLSEAQRLAREWSPE